MSGRIQSIAVVLLVAILCVLSACGGKEGAPRIECADTKALTEIIGDDYLLPTLPGDLGGRWDTALYYRTRWDVPYKEKSRYASGYEYELTALDQDDPIRMIRLRGRPEENETSEYGDWLTGQYNLLSEETLAAGDYPITYREFSSPNQQREPVIEAPSIIYATSLREGILYAIEIQPSRLPIYPHDYRMQIIAYYEGLYEGT